MPRTLLPPNRTLSGPPNALRTVHENFIRELCLPSRRRAEGVGRYLTQRLTLGRGHLSRQGKFEFAFWRANKLDW